MAKGGKAAGALKRSPTHLLHRALQLALDIYGQELGQGAVTQRQFAVLHAVASEDGLSQTGLVRATGIDRSTVAELVARMTRLGLLERSRSTEDARTNAVRLTERGREMLDGAQPRVSAADKRLLKRLPAKKRDSFIRLLQDLTQEPLTDPASPADAAEGKGAKSKPAMPTRDRKLQSEPTAE